MDQLVSAPPREGSASHEAARAASYRFIESVQAAPHAHHAEGLREQAELQGWSDVVFLLDYADVAEARMAGLDIADPLARMRLDAEGRRDDVHTALARAACAEVVAVDGSWSESERTERDLASAVALLQQGEGTRADAALAYVAIAIAYNRRSLWELEQEMYDRIATRDGDADDAGAAQEFIHRVIGYNQRESCVAWSCALLEAGDRDGARVVARRGIAAPRVEIAAMPLGWQREIRAIDLLLEALAGTGHRVRAGGAPPVERSVEAVEDLFEDTAWAGTRGFVALASAVRHADDGAVDEAARLGDLALQHFDVDLVPAARLLAMALRARAVGGSDVQDYLGEQARLRSQSRLLLLGAARSRIEVESMALEHDRLRRHAYVDEVTGLANRHALTRQRHRLHGHRDGRRVAALMVDIDHFKQVNDVHGHDAGDRVLATVARLVQEAVRPIDFAARMGGDELVALVDDLGHESATQRAAALVRSVARHDWSSIAAGLAVTVSIGVSAGDACDVDAVLVEADRQLYLAKAAGRGTFRGTA
jgi:diguanylate cyclase (GGDEF)-like protein